MSDTLHDALAADGSPLALRALQRIQLLEESLQQAAVNASDTAAIRKAALAQQSNTIMRLRTVIHQLDPHHPDGLRPVPWIERMES